MNDTRAAAGAEPLMVRQYRGEAPLWPFDEQGGMKEAAQACTTQLLADLTPKQVTRQRQLDTSDPLGKPGLEACEAKRFDDALQKFTEASEKAPQSAALVYNRGVLSLWRGQVEDAATLLSQAVAMKPGERRYEEAKVFSDGAVKALRRTPR